MTRHQGERVRDLVTCESVAAITLHAREVVDIAVGYSGFAKRPKALCGDEVAWDTRIPVSNTRCRKCIAAMTAFELRPRAIAKLKERA